MAGRDSLTSTVVVTLPAALVDAAALVDEFWRAWPAYSGGLCSPEYSVRPYSTSSAAAASLESSDERAIERKDG